MNSFTFTPRLESLVDRLCLSVTGGELMLGDMPKTGEEAGLIGLLHSGEEVGAAVDYKAGESGWDVKPGEEVGAAVDLKTGESGWDVKPGEEQGAAVDYNLLLPAIRVDDAGEERGVIAILKAGEDAGAAVDRKAGESGWDVMPGEEQGAAVDYLLPAV